MLLMNSVLLELEQAVIAQLKSAALGITVEPYPNSPGDYSLLDPAGAALVVIRGSRYEQQFNGVQNRATRIIVTLLVRNLNAHQGAYALIDAIAMALMGWTPPIQGSGQNWCGLRVVSDQYVNEDNGVWQYDMMFETSRLAVSAYNPCY